MIFIISPAKTLDFEANTPNITPSTPALLSESELLIKRAQNYSPTDLMQLMEISPALAELNYQRFQNWRTPFTAENARPAILAFKGDVYEGLAASTFSDDDFNYAQQHLRILSGLYGVLRPLDLMQAYRLEMGRKIDTTRGKNLYQFWGELITEQLNQQLQSLQSDLVINLASQEYWKAVKPKQLKAQVITVEFRDQKNGQYKMLGVYAKRARGLLSRYAITEKISQPSQLKAFNCEGYQYNNELSSQSNWVFTREKPYTQSR